jgi:hypothetical protein
MKNQKREIEIEIENVMNNKNIKLFIKN